MSNIQIKEITYKSYKNCIQISNGEINLIVTTQEGPRIIRYGLMENETNFVMMHH